MEIQKSVRRVFICVFVAVVAVSYDRAVAGRDNTTDIDSTIYGKVRREMSVSSVVLPTGDTLDVKIQHVRVTKDIAGATDESLKRYSVVAGQFKQRFNAASLRERLAGAGLSHITMLCLCHRTRLKKHRLFWTDVERIRRYRSGSRCRSYSAVRADSGGYR